MDNTAPPTIDYVVRPSGPLRGEIRVPGDKSVSHRCVMLGAIADGDTRVGGLLEGEDVLATVTAFRSMGVEIEGPHEGEAFIRGVGRDGLHAPASGPRPRKLGHRDAPAGRACSAGQRFGCTLVGDASLRSPPDATDYRAVESGWEHGSKPRTVEPRRFGSAPAMDLRRSTARCRWPAPR